MGQGEPLNNITNVARAVKQMTSPTAFRLGRSKVGLDLSAKLPREVVLALSSARPPRARFLLMLLRRYVRTRARQRKNATDWRDPVLQMAPVISRSTRTRAHVRGCGCACACACVAPV